MGCLFSRVRMTNAILLGIISQVAGMFSNQNHTRDFYKPRWLVQAQKTTDFIGICLWGLELVCYVYKITL